MGTTTLGMKSIKDEHPTLLPQSSPTTAVSSPTSTAPPVFTQKEWIIPPRPKPGRKPAVDVPHTKRKAQNREAQRAFRQRRAAKVNELEDQMSHSKEEYDVKVARLEAEIVSLKARIAEFERFNAECRNRLVESQNELHTQNDLVSRLREAFSRLGVTEPSDVPQTQPRHELQEETSTQNEVDLTCGGCRTDTKCQCAEDALQMSQFEAEIPIKRVRSSLEPEIQHKRIRGPTGFDESNEIDFTTKPIGLPTTQSTSSSNYVTSGAIPDNCGFCTDGANCVCAAMFPSEPQQQQDDQPIPPPPPIPASIEILPLRPTSDSCNSEPGSCSQCQEDPQSKLFCKSLAATRAATFGNNPPSPVSPTSDFASSDGYKSRNSDLPTSYPSKGATSTATTNNTSMSCADAYRTLTTNPNYHRASQEMGSWVPQLASHSVPTAHNRPYRPGPDAPSVTQMFLKSGQQSRVQPRTIVSRTKTGDHRHTQGFANNTDAATDAADATALSFADIRGRPQPMEMAGRTAFEIDCAGIMGTMRFFDRRFGAEKDGTSSRGVTPMNSPTIASAPEFLDRPRMPVADDHHSPRSASRRASPIHSPIPNTSSDVAGTFIDIDMGLEMREVL